MKKRKTFENDYMKAIKRADREQEIEDYGKQVSFQKSKVHRSEKDYNRQKSKRVNLIEDDDEYDM